MSRAAPPVDRVRRGIRVAGVVQGVGFRPFVRRLATELDLAGIVGNDPDGVFVEVEGGPGEVARFESRLLGEAPPLARIQAVEAVPLRTVGETGFRIVGSRSGASGRTFVSPDVAVCDECLAEMDDPSDRRYRYPFINCTNCGPRFTITVRLPYDRANTTMDRFELCRSCSAEYHDPADRRYHAQPIACPDCGPRVWFEQDGEATPPSGDRALDGDSALAAAQVALARGQIVAVKGLGGYHLACDATCAGAVEELRRRKRRVGKPFAVMVADLDAASRLALLGRREAELLSSPQRPIVLVRRAPGSEVAEQVAPGNPHIGVLLPYTPLHHLLFRALPGQPAPVPGPLVMTSGNLTDDPICFEDGAARRRLGPLVDAWLLHDRPIHVPCDDSVVRVDDGLELPIRRSRGYAPLPVRLPVGVAPTLATGGELKNTFCVASGRDAWMSQHIGDMGSVEALEAFGRSAAQFSAMYDVEPGRFAADAHPGYQVRRWAEEHAAGRNLLLIQHHHAHIAAVMAEHGVAAAERVIGFAFDGTGYGPDGAIWGGEALVAGYGDFDRAAHLRYVLLPGGDASIHKPYRTALSHLRAAGIPWGDDLEPVGAAPAEELVSLERQLERHVSCVATSSMGRLFDAVSSLLGVRHTVSYEAQAAIELEAVAWEAAGPDECGYRFAMSGEDIDPGPALAAIVADIRRGRPTGSIAFGFHAAVARMVGETAERLRRATGLHRVALSGGVFQNVLVLRLVRRELTGRGLQVLTHRVVPPNDGGLALGQAIIAGTRATAGGAGP